MTPPPIWGLADLNAFYVSCEVAMRPRLAGRPVVVMSNNFGNVVSRSPEAKALKIRMAQPWFELKPLVRSHGLIALASNFPLYADMSRRVMTILGDMLPAHEIYSVDELFGLFRGIADPPALARQMRARVLQWTGLAMCVGLGASRVQSKLSNHIAKKNPQFDGVFDLSALSDVERTDWMARIEVGEVWGIGQRYADRLQARGILTVADLRGADTGAIRGQFGVVVERIVRELRGQSCLGPQCLPPRSQQLLCSRSFARETQTFEEVRAAVLRHISRAAEKLRAQGSQASAGLVFVGSNPFKPQAPRYAASRAFALAQPSDDTLTLAHHADAALRRAWRPGIAYKRAGVLLTELSPTGTRQQELFEDTEAQARRARLNGALDAVNQRYGRGTLVLAGAGLSPASVPSGQLPRWTTAWADLPRVR